MTKPKLDLYSKTDGQLEQFAQTHRDKLLGNSAFPAPTPSVADYAAALDEFTDSVDEMTEGAAIQQAKVSRKNQAREKLVAVIIQRGGYVSTASAGDPTLILSAGFELADTNRAPVDLLAPANLAATQGDGSGIIDLMWDSPAGARAHAIECRINDESLPWQQAGLTTKSRLTIPNLQSGKTYAFRVKSIGAKGESPWSLVIVKLVA
jgi:hypothetical protein